MIRAYHVIVSAYGFWLPNDPRGSWSDFVRRYELVRHGKATKTDTRRSVAGLAHDRAQRQRAKQALRHKPVRFTGRMAQCVGRAFAEAAEVSSYRIHAFSIMPDHAHLVIGRHHYTIEQIVRRLKQAATTRLRDEGFRIDPPSPWARGLWKVYLNDSAAVERAIRYVNDNPVKDGLPRQRWKFVVPYVA